jgi:hypothetical protein
MHSTFGNSDNLSVCEMCGTPRGTNTMSNLQAAAQQQVVTSIPTAAAAPAKPSEDAAKAGLFTKGGSPALVPLRAVSIFGTVRQVTSQITLQQTYFNAESVAIEAVYIFPIEDKAAICGFKAEINGKVINGVVQGKKKARETYTKAITEGHGAYLLEQKLKNQFEISVGNIPPQVGAFECDDRPRT